MVGFVNIPINLGLSALQAQTAKAQQIIQGLGTSVASLGMNAQGTSQQIFNTVNSITRLYATVNNLANTASSAVVNVTSTVSTTKDAIGALVGTSANANNGLKLLAASSAKTSSALALVADSTVSAIKPLNQIVSTSSAITKATNASSQALVNSSEKIAQSSVSLARISRVNETAIQSYKNLGSAVTNASKVIDVGVNSSQKVTTQTIISDFVNTIGEVVKPQVEKVKAVSKQVSTAVNEIGTQASSTSKKISDTVNNTANFVKKSTDFTRDASKAVVDVGATASTVNSSIVNISKSATQTSSAIAQLGSNVTTVNGGIVQSVSNIGKTSASTTKALTGVSDSLVRISGVNSTAIQSFNELKGAATSASKVIDATVNSSQRVTSQSIISDIFSKFSPQVKQAADTVTNAVNNTVNSVNNASKSVGDFVKKVTTFGKSAADSVVNVSATTVDTGGAITNISKVVDNASKSVSNLANNTSSAIQPLSSLNRTSNEIANTFNSTRAAVEKSSSALANIPKANNTAIESFRQLNNSAIESFKTLATGSRGASGGLGGGVGNGFGGASAPKPDFIDVDVLSSKKVTLGSEIDDFGQKAAKRVVDFFKKDLPEAGENIKKASSTGFDYFRGINSAILDVTSRFTGLNNVVKIAGLESVNTKNKFVNFFDTVKKGLSGGIFNIPGDPFAKTMIAVSALQSTIGTVMTGVNLYAKDFGLIFAPITSNFLMLNAIATKYSSSGLTILGRYGNYASLAGIMKELVAKGTAFNLALDVASRPAKLVRELMTVGRTIGLITAQVQGAILQVNTLSTGLLASASSLSKGGGFLMPGQLSPGATVYDMFDPQQALESSINFERLLGGFRAIATVSGGTQGQIGEIGQEILKLGIDTGQTNEQVAATATRLVRLGYPIDGLVGQLRGLSYTAVATGESMLNISRDVLDVAKIFNISAAETERVGSLLTQASLENGTAISQYAASIRAMGVVAANSGQSLENIVTILASVSKSGIEGSNAGNSLSNILTNLQNIASAQSGTKVDLLSQLGISQGDLLQSDGSLKSIVEVFNIIRGKVDEFSKANGKAASNSLLTAIFGGNDANFVSAVIKNTESEIQNLNNTLLTSSEVSQKISDIQGNTLLGNLQRISDAASTVSTTFGNFLAPIFNTIIGGITNVVVAFAKLPPAVQIGIAGFNALIPFLFLYVCGVRAVVQWQKFVILTQTLWGKAMEVSHALWNTLLRLSTGELTVTTLATNALTKAQATQRAVVTALTPAYVSFSTTIKAVATGQLSFAAATSGVTKTLTTFLGNIKAVASGNARFVETFPRLTKALEAFGAANVKDFMSTTKASTEIMARQIGVVLRLAATLGTAYIAFLALSELFKRSEGAKFAADVDKSNVAFVKANLQLFTYQDNLKIFSNQFGGNLRAMGLEVTRFTTSVRDSIGNAIKGFGELKDEVKNVGLVETFRQQLEGKDLINLAPPLIVLNTVVNGLTGNVRTASDIVSDYGEEWKIATGAQIGNAQAALAMESQQIIVNKLLDQGYKTLGLYTVGTKLSAAESENFKAALTSQITSLEEQKKTLLGQKPPTEDLKRLQEAQILLLDKQINLARGRIKSLSDEGNTIKNIVVPSYDELISKYQELERKGKLETTNRQITIETEVVEGKSTSKDAEEKKLLANRIRINEELKRTQELRSNLEASKAGQTDAEQQVKIQDELNKIVQQEADLRLEAVQNQGKIVENNQQNDIEKARVGILRTQSFEKLHQLKLEQDIAAGKVKGNDIEKERNRIQLESLQAQLSQNQAAQKALTGKPGEVIATDQKKLKDEAIELQSQIAQAQIQEQERVTQIRTEQEQKVKEEQEKAKEDQLKKEEEVKEVRLKQEEEVKEAALKAVDERFRRQQTQSEKLTNQSGIKSAKNDFRSAELQAQQQLSETLASLDSQRLNFQLEIANRSQNAAQSEQLKLKIYQEQQAQLTLQQTQQRQSLALSREQQQLDIERKKLSADLAILEAEANLEKAKTNGDSAVEIASLETAIAIRKDQRALIDQEAQSIQKVNTIESQRIGIENQVKAEQLKQQRILELQDLAVQKITTSLEAQKAAIESQSARLDLVSKSLERQSQILSAQQQLTEANANLEKQRLDYQLSLANLSGDFNRIEQTKAGIYLQQREEILRQIEAQQASVSLSRQQQELELQRQQLQAQSALLEAQANVERAKAQGVSGQQLAILQQSVGIQQAQLDAIAQQRTASEQLNSLEAQRAAVESQIKLEQLDQQRQMELIEAKAQQIADAFERQREQLDLSSQSLELNASRLDRQSNLLNAQSGVRDAQANLEKQSLDYQLQLAEIRGDDTAKQQLKQALYHQELSALASRFQVDQQSLKIAEEKQKIDLQRQKIQSEIAALEAQSNLEQAKAKGASKGELASLSRVLELRKQQQSSILEEQANAQEIQKLDRQKLGLEQQAAEQQVNQSYSLEQARLTQEQINAAKEEQDKLAKDQTSELEKQNKLLDEQQKKVAVLVEASESVTKVTYSGETAGEDLKATTFAGAADYAKSLQPPPPPPVDDTAKKVAEAVKEQQQQLQQATINAQTVYLNGQVMGQAQNEVVKISQVESNPEARLTAAQQAMDAYIKQFNAEAEQERIRSGLTAEQATAGGYQQSAIAREEAARIRADLASGRLRTTAGNFNPQQMVTPLQKLQQELNAAQKAADSKKQSEKKDPAKLYDLVAQIYGHLQQNGGGNKVDNLVVVSSDPTGDAREVLNQLTRSKRNC